MQHYDVMILGAGAAGLMCALTAGSRGYSVMVLEKSNKAGKKILMSGGGRCNFTNLSVEPENYLSTNPHFCKSALKQYSQWDFIALVEKHGIEFYEKELGQLFCNNSSKEILNMLLEECEAVGVKILLNIQVETVRPGFDKQHLLSSNIGDFTCNDLVIATGGLSIPKMGGSGFGYELAEQLGLRVLSKTAGLVPFVFTDKYRELFSKLSGLSVYAQVTVADKSFTNQILFTHRGISGPAILQISNYWSHGEDLHIDLMPDHDLVEILKQAKNTQANTSLLNFLTQMLTRKLVQSLIKTDLLDCKLQILSDSLCHSIAMTLKNWTLKPAGTEGYRTAEVTLGGIDSKQLSSKTMASIEHPNIFFIGEVVDVTGQLGGYNFQWAWSSAYVAGMSVGTNHNATV
ncbi:MAG: NAD(P)/FAD-dependent oxidoreductase [Proteobacteria bacterium]|nr:NAD(P)/FAD-dependent oxidoreductase [Pseudomonadota bacterium]